MKYQDLKAKAKEFLEARLDAGDPPADEVLEEVVSETWGSYVGGCSPATYLERLLTLLNSKTDLMYWTAKVDEPTTLADLAQVVVTDSLMADLKRELGQ